MATRSPLGSRPLHSARGPGADSPGVRCSLAGPPTPGAWREGASSLLPCLPLGRGECELQGLLPPEPGQARTDLRRPCSSARVPRGRTETRHHSRSPGPRGREERAADFIPKRTWCNWPLPPAKPESVVDWLPRLGWQLLRGSPPMTGDLAHMPSRTGYPGSLTPDPGVRSCSGSTLSCGGWAETVEGTQGSGLLGAGETHRGERGRGSRSQGGSISPPSSLDPLGNVPPRGCLSSRSKPPGGPTAAGSSLSPRLLWVASW